LPQINCGACGLSGCEEFARRVVEEKKLYTCIPGGEEVNRKIAEILGLKAEKINPMLPKTINPSIASFII